MKKKHMNIITMTTIMTRKTNMSIIIMTTMTMTTSMTSMNIIITIIMTMTMIMKAEKLRNTESAPSFTIVASLSTWVSSMIS